MNHISCIRRSVAGLTGLAGIVVAYGMAMPAALATTRPEPPGWYKHPSLPAQVLASPRPELPGWYKHPSLPVQVLASPRAEPPGWYKHPSLPVPARVHTMVSVGMQSWQIALIVTTALLVTALAVLAARTWAARRLIPSRAARPATTS